MPDGNRRGLAVIGDRVPAFLPELGSDWDRPLSAVLSHGTFQAIVLAATRLLPNLSRDAINGGATARDLDEWIRTADTASEILLEPAGRPPRGSYRTDTVTLRPIRDSDLQGLYEASLHPPAAHRWRFRGQTPSPESFRTLLFDPGVLAQLIVTPLGRSDEPIGIVIAYRADFVGRHCQIAFQRSAHESTAVDASATGGLMIEGLLVFIQYVLDHFPFEKLYFEIPEYNESLISGGPGALLAKEGELKDHFYYGDRTWSLNIYSLYRSSWDAIADGLRGEWEGREPPPSAPF